MATLPIVSFSESVRECVLLKSGEDLRLELWRDACPCRSHLCTLCMCAALPNTLLYCCCHSWKFNLAVSFERLTQFKMIKWHDCSYMINTCTACASIFCTVKYPFTFCSWEEREHLNHAGHLTSSLCAFGRLRVCWFCSCLLLDIGCLNYLKSSWFSWYTASVQSTDVFPLSMMGSSCS